MENPVGINNYKENIHLNIVLNDHICMNRHSTATYVFVLSNYLPYGGWRNTRSNYL